MLNTLGVVQVRPESMLCPLSAGRRLHGRSLVEWVVRRVSDSQRLDCIVALVTSELADRGIVEMIPADVETVVSDADDELGRLCEAVERFAPHSIVRILADSPFVDPVLIDRLVNCAAVEPQHDYLGYRLRDGRPVGQTSLGIFAEWFTAAALRRVDRDALKAADRADVTSYFQRNSKRYRVRLMPVPEQLDRDDVRLTLERHEDWDHAQTIVEALGHDHLDWQRIAGLLHTQPQLRARMAMLNKNSAAA